MEENTYKYSEKNEEETEEMLKELCPICGEELIIVAHCKTCYSCGYGTCDL